MFLVVIFIELPRAPSMTIVFHMSWQIDSHWRPDNSARLVSINLAIPRIMRLNNFSSSYTKVSLAMGTKLISYNWNISANSGL